MSGKGSGHTNWNSQLGSIHLEFCLIFSVFQLYHNKTDTVVRDSEQRLPVSNHGRLK